MAAQAQLLTCALLAALLAGPTASRPRHIFFMKGPTSPQLPNMTWRMLQQDPETSFTEQHLREMIRLLGADNFTSEAVKVGVTFQWELLDCFLSPHDCTPEQVAEELQISYLLQPPRAFQWRSPWTRRSSTTHRACGTGLIRTSLTMIRRTCKMSSGRAGTRRLQ